MLGRIKKLLHREYQPLNTIIINRKNLEFNYRYLSSINRKLKVAPVLKSNAYGHGLVLIATELEKLNPPFLCVDSLYEAYELLKVGVKTKILIMGYVDPISLKTKHLPFSFAVYNYETVEALKEYQPLSNIHIFVDTGMHREGIEIARLEEFVKYISSNTHLNIEGLMSHYASSEDVTDTLNSKQTHNFLKAIDVLKKLKIKPKFIHIANSGGLINSKKMLTPGNVARVGIATFGIDPAGDESKLNPILSLLTHVAQIKDIRNGDTVGYNATFTAKKSMKIAVLPIGYNDGIDRRLSNIGYVKIQNTFCKIIGRISMNITMIDVSHILEIEVGDEVVVFSDNPTDKNSIENAAKLCKTIPYDLLVGLHPSTKRILFE